MKANRSVFSPSLQLKNSKSVTKLILLIEIVAICILHSVKLSDDGHKPIQQTSKSGYAIEKKMAQTTIISFTSNR